MLKELTDLDRHSRWSETKRRIDSDPRYKAIESSSRREDWFRDYIKTLNEVRRHSHKDKEDQVKAAPHITSH